MRLLPPNQTLPSSETPPQILGDAPYLEAVLALAARDECNSFSYWDPQYERVAVG